MEKTSSRGRSRAKAGSIRAQQAWEKEAAKRPVRPDAPRGRGSSRRPSGSNFLIQGSILAVAGIIVRLIGMLYRIPLASLIGDVGNGYYSAAYGIYSTLLIMSSYSLPVAVSKMIAQRLAVGQYRNNARILRASLFYATLAGGACFCIMWFGADFFATDILKMPYCSYALRMLAPTVWVMAYLGVLRGYFQGHSTMTPTAVSQILEQIINAAISLIAAGYLFQVGLRSNLVYGSDQYSYAFGAVGATMGTGAGALAALIFFLFLMAGGRRASRARIARDTGNSVESYRSISYVMFMTIMPILISSTIYNSGTVIDNVIFGQMMDSRGVSEQNIASLWGVYSGRYHLLFNIPVAIANSLSSSLIPALSMAVAERKKSEVRSRISMAIRFSMIIAIPSAVGMTVLAGPISRLLFSGMDNTMLVRMLWYGSAAVVVYSLSTVTNGVLQGISRMRSPIVNASIAMVLHAVFLAVMLLLGTGIYGVVFANIVFALLVCIFNAVSIARYTGYRQEIVRTFLVPAAASVIMGGAAFGIYRLCSMVMGNALSTVASVLAAVLVYFVLLLKLGGVTERELGRMPGGSRILRVARKLHLM